MTCTAADKFADRPADNQVVDRCSTCGAALTAGATWCGQCFARVAEPPAGFRPAAGAPFTPLPSRTTRWGKTPTTFGPVGRVVASVLLLVPLAIMVVGGLADPFVWGGAGLYGAVIVPWALRDIWKAGRVVVVAARR